MRIARVFPRRTNATPTDDLAFVGPPGLFPPEVDEVHVSVTFTWDLPEAERLVRAWSSIAPTKIGGPATGMRGEEFTPGMYLKPGYVITSRGCPNHCWFCLVPKREGLIRELNVNTGWNVLDDNILACSQTHRDKVFDMLKSQGHSIEFTGGLEAARLTGAMAAELRELKPKSVYFAFDTPDDWEPLEAATKLMFNAGFTKESHRVRAYVLCGWPKDTMAEAECRMKMVMDLGVFPFAMLWRKYDGSFRPDWRRFQKQWVRPHNVISAYTYLSHRSPQVKAASNPQAERYE